MRAPVPGAGNFSASFAAVVLTLIGIFGGGHPRVEYRLKEGARRDQRFLGNVTSSGSVSFSFISAEQGARKGMN